MSFIKLTRDLIENVSVTLRPRIHFISSSLGVTGSAFVAPFRSKTLKNPINPNVLGNNSYDPDSPTNPGYDESDYEVLNLIDEASVYVREQTAQGNSADIQPYMSRYLEAVNDAPENLRNTKSLDVFTFQMGSNYIFNKEVVEKNNIRKNIMPFHRTRYQNSGFQYTNYNCLNFYTASNVPTGSCLIYSNVTPTENYIYGLTGPFTFDFWINPRYTTDSETDEFRAGTIYHHSSAFALSLVTGSSRDAAGYPDGYRLLLQLSSSADTPPSQVSLNETLVYPKDLIFSSSDNSLKRNQWHHVTVRWGTSLYNEGTGSIAIDDLDPVFFNVPSSSIDHNVDAIFFGNYYNGPDSNIPNFFNSSVATAEGLYPNPGGVSAEVVNADTLSHPLNAEIHDFKIYNEFRTNLELNNTRYQGPSSYDNLLFFVPPFFTPETRQREVLVTPFQKIESSTNDPFNVSFSFGVGGKLINLENFTREFVRGNYPRLYHLTASTINSTIENITADQYTYASGSIIKRNFTVLPCDNGYFKPDYFPLVSGSNTMFKNESGNVDYSIISLHSLIPTASLFEGLVYQSGSIMDRIMGASPENPGVNPGAVLTVAQRTRDVSSNLITIYDISNLYYGNRIHPRTFKCIDDNLSGSDGKIQVTFKDNGYGSLYRADAIGPHPTWSNCGNIFYDEGIVIIKTPHTINYSKDRTDLEFRGEQNLHTYTISAPCPNNMFNSSSNPQYRILSASNEINDTNSEFVYITNVNIHDDNLNVIMRANLAQPITKRYDDAYMFKLKYDF